MSSAYIKNMYGFGGSSPIPPPVCILLPHSPQLPFSRGPFRPISFAFLSFCDRGDGGAEGDAALARGVAEATGVARGAGADAGVARGAEGDATGVAGAT